MCFERKNEKHIIIIKCMEGCPFHIRMDKSSNKSYYHIVSLEAIDTCHKTTRNKQAKTKLLAKKNVVSLFSHTQNVKLGVLQDEAKTRW